MSLCVPVIPEYTKIEKQGISDKIPYSVESILLEYGVGFPLYSYIRWPLQCTVHIPIIRGRIQNWMKNILRILNYAELTVIKNTVMCLYRN